MNDLIQSQYSIKNLDKNKFQKAVIIQNNTPVDEMLKIVSQNSNLNCFYIINDNEELTGIITMVSIMDYLFPFFSSGTICTFKTNFSVLSLTTVIADDLMDFNFSYVYEETSLSDTVEMMKKKIIDEIPVVNEERNVIGVVKFTDIISFYLNQKGGL